MKPISFIFAFLLSLLSFGQMAGVNDSTFNVSDLGFGRGDGANNPIYKIHRLPTGKYLMAGLYNYYNYKTHFPSMIRLNSDGTHDNTFLANILSGAIVQSFDLQSDGKIIMVGDNFITSGPAINSRIVRLNTDGSTDYTFNVGTGPNTTVYEVLVQADDKILIFGSFTSFNGTAVTRLVRLNANGSLDNTFNSGACIGTGAVNVLEEMKIQSDGKIYLVGTFTSYNGNPVKNYVRLNSNGSIDATFNHNNEPDNAIKSLEILPDGKIIMAGYFTQVSGQTINRIFRMEANGNLDLSFNPGAGPNSFVKNTFLQPDNKILIFGLFSSVDGVNRNMFAQLNADGSLDNTFDPGGGFSYYNDEVNSFISHSDGTTLVAGDFERYDGRVKNCITLINSDGSINDTFNKGNGVVNSGWPNGTNLFAIEVQEDDKILIGGRFRSFNSVNRDYIARLLPDGSLDSTFIVGTGFEGPFSACFVHSIAVQEEGKVIAGGRFFDYDGDTVNNILRLNSDGSLDNSFMIGYGCDGEVRKIQMQADGKILVIGNFTHFNGTAVKYIVRLNPDGSIDNTFNTGVGPDSYLGTFFLQDDGKIILSGEFTNFNGTPANKLIRLNSDGSVDNSFSAGSGPSSRIKVITVLDDDKILLGGAFTSYNGTNINRLARLNTDGSIDNSFNVGTGASDSVNAIIVEANGTILIAGRFSSFNGVSASRMIRLNSDGSIDNTFSAGTGTNNEIKCLAKQHNGRILLGGYFTSYNNKGRNRIARIFNCEVPVIEDTLSASRCGEGSVDLSASSLSGVINWYSEPVGGVPLATSSTFTTPNLTATTVFYAEAATEICSSERISLSAEIIPSPVFEDLGLLCDTMGAFVLDYASPVGGTYSIDGVAQTSFNPSTADLGETIITYTISQTGVLCSSSDTVVVANCAENGLDDLSSGKIELYPNPSKGLIEISGLVDTDNYSFELYDQQGRLVKTFKSSPFDPSLFDTGIYQLKVTGTNTSEIYKLYLVK